MSRNWGIMTGSRLRPDGATNSTRADSHGADTQHGAKIIQLRTLPLPLAPNTRQSTGDGLRPSPSFFLDRPPEPFVARHPIKQTVLDVGAVIIAALFVCVTGVGVGAALFILLTVTL